MKIEKEQMNAPFRQYLEGMFKEQNPFNNELINLIHSPNVVITKFRDLGYIEACSKRLPIISDKNLFVEKFATQQQQDTNFYYYIMASKITGYDFIHAGAGAEQAREETWFKTNDFPLLQSWFIGSNQMLDSKRIIYAPTFEKVKLTEQFSFGFSAESQGEFLNHTGMNLEVVQRSPLRYDTPFSAAPKSEIEINKEGLVPLIHLNIPAIDNITASQLSQIMDDYPNKLLRFRNHLQRKLLDLKSEIGSEDFSREISRIQLDLKDGLMQLEDKVKQLKKVKAIEVIGAQFVVWSLYVLVFMSSPNELLKILLPGGALGSLSKTLAEYLKGNYQLGNNPLSFLLLVSKEAKRLA